MQLLTERQLSRFVPRYLKAYAQVRERQRLVEEAERQEVAILAELAAILIEVARNRVKIDLSSLPVATAREICRLLREIK